ncbi:hypothetical protein C8F04DRAFT_1281189 [Mycena alexandri]|uniref:Uncharacterized protein n=1 Tax=Mycena alexandri TaxID=1745969 RepID=A0AAD6WL85_9AGAR|nr:hypothetical protein C8F04DRAFT_1281189 [Mycena alexandri]
MNIRLKLDCTLTDTGKYGTRALKKDLVLKTWVRVLKNKVNLPKDWTREAEVLLLESRKLQSPTRRAAMKCVLGKQTKMLPNAKDGEQNASQAKPNPENGYTN